MYWLQTLTRIGFKATMCCRILTPYIVGYSTVSGSPSEVSLRPSIADQIYGRFLKLWPAIVINFLVCTSNYLSDCDGPIAPNSPSCHPTHERKRKEISYAKPRQSGNLQLSTFSSNIQFIVRPWPFTCILIRDTTQPHHREPI